MSEKVIIDEKTMLRTLARLAHEIIERNPGAETLCLLGIRRKGVPLAKMIAENIERFSEIKVLLGEVDITLYRDDLTQIFPQPQVNNTSIDFDVNGKTIIMVDDVLYTGRTARAAMDAIMQLGRPAVIELAVMVDRGHRELPILANYVGKNIPTSRDEFVSVKLPETDGAAGVSIIRK